MKSLFKSAISILLFGLAVLPTHAAFKAVYVFGDALSSTTNNPQVGPLYYGQRYSNGRVWVEVLAQRQGLTYAASNNNSYYDHTSATLATEIKNFVAPSDASNDLFVVWVCNADTFDAASANDTSNQWVTAINLAQTNHLLIITNLYAKGVRTLILPNAVDISKIPAFNAGSSTNVMRNGCVSYNFAFSNTISRARTLCPNLKIYTPNFFSLLDNVLTNAANYGLTNFIAGGHSMDAADAINYGYPPAATNGFGTNFIFWDFMDPTAKFHEVIADVVQQLISPVRINGIVVFNGSNRLDVVNVPVGLNGFVEGCTNILPANWISLTNITSISTNQSIFVAQSGGGTSPAFSGGGDAIKPADSGLLGGPTPPYDMHLYRLRFPYAWSWP